MTDAEQTRREARTPASPDEKTHARPEPRAASPGVKEIGGPAGPEPTRYGDWERKGIASDF